MKEFDSFTDKQIIKYLHAFGLDYSTSNQFLTLVRSWEENSGVEWTIKRLKSVKTAYIRKIAGLSPFVHSPWIKLDRRKSNPLGPLGVIFRLPKAKALGCIMIYTMYVSKKATQSQLDKFKSGVVSTKVDPFTKSELEGMLSHCPSLRNLSKIRSKSRFSDISSWYSRQTRVPRFIDQDLTEVRSRPNGIEALLESASHPLATKYFESLYASGKDFPDDLYNVYAKATAEPEYIDYSDLERNVVGSVGYIQEVGFKLRTIANPFPIFQVLLSRLGNRVYDLLSHIPEDCTFDQDKGVRDIQDAIKSGIELSALDLSSATDRFPADITFKLLEILDFEDIDIDLFVSLSRGIWKLPDGKEISWTNGQPLGVYPSFGAFALSHHLIIQSLKPRFYRILGDDLVISKDCLDKAREIYAKIGVPISEDKSIDSPILTEFGGRLITAEKILTQPKWRVISDRSFVDLAKSIGPGVFHILQPRQARIVKLLSEIPQELHPYGLNWNPKGKPFSLRASESAEVIKLLHSTVIESKGDSTTLNNRLLYESKFVLLSEFPLRNLEIKADENLSANGRHRLSGDTKTRVLANANIKYINVFDDDCDESLSLESKWFSSVPLTSDPRGITTLELIEKKLRSKPKH